jgi:hypothetical protein
MNHNQYIKSAINLRDLLRLWSDDVEYISRGGKIVYAVDTDVIKMYSDNENNYKYATIFPGEKVYDSKVLVWSLSRYIFDKIHSSINPLLLITPHNKELKSILYSIMISASKEHRRFVDHSEAIKKIFKKYDETKNEELLLDDLADEPLCLIHYLTDESIGYTAELSKITKLIKKGVIKPLIHYSDKDGNLFPELYDTVNESHYKILKNSKKKWNDLLRMNSPENIYKPISKYEENLLVDSEVMSRLEFINKNIQVNNIRLVLITGDAKIHNATKSVRWDKDHSFKDLFIRDPKVFFAAPDFFVLNNSDVCETSNEKRNDLAKWMDVGLVGIMERLDEDDKKYTDRNSDEYIDERIADIEQIKNSWNEYVGRNIVNCGFKIEDAADKLKRFITDHTFSDIESMVDKKVCEVWHDFWKVSTRVGYWAIRDIENIEGFVTDNNSSSLLPLRGIPAIKLTYPKAMGEIYNLCQSLAHNRVVENGEVFQRLEKEDPTDYTAFLVYALAFGAAGKWSVSCILSEIALTIADMINNDGENEVHELITGNEAAYIWAWSIRHSSRKKNVLLKAKVYIDEAKKRKKKALGTDFDLRYECEDIGIDMTYNMYFLFMDDRSDYDNTFLGIKECRDRAKVIIEEIDLMAAQSQVSSQDVLIILMVRRQALTYYYLSTIILIYRQSVLIDDNELEYAKKHVRLYKEVIGTKEYIIRSCINSAIYLVASFVFGDPTIENDSLSDITLVFDEKNIENCSIMPYDKNLYKFLKDVVNICIKNVL